MKYWLFKTEPDEFSIDDLSASPKRTTFWDGVRNYQARNFMRDEMKIGDPGFFYHSSCAEPGIAGTVVVTRQGYPDKTAFDPADKHFDPKSKPDDPRWFGVDIRLECKFGNILTLRKLKQYAGDRLSDMQLLKRGNRLSVMPVSERDWKFILELAQKTDCHNR